MFWCKNVLYNMFFSVLLSLYSRIASFREPLNRFGTFSGTSINHYKSLYRSPLMDSIPNLHSNEGK